MYHVEVVCFCQLYGFVQLSAVYFSDGYMGRVGGGGGGESRIGKEGKCETCSVILVFSQNLVAIYFV